MLYINSVYQMASKLESYSEVILAALANGRSYRSVANDLLHLGVEVTAQSIWSWHTRRQRRIEKRRSKFALTPVQVGASPHEASAADSIRSPTPMPRPPPVNPDSTQRTATLQALRDRIDEQTRQQEDNPWAGMVDQFLVRR